MGLDPAILKCLCCPETHKPLALADPALIGKLNDQLLAGKLRNRVGQPLASRLDGGLLRQDGKFLYPIHGGLPVLLVDEAIPVVELSTP